MSKVRLLLVSASLCLGVSAASAQTVPDASIVDPDAHQIILENEHVRVFQALASPGRKSPMHSHPPFVFVSLGTARLRLTSPDAKSQILDVRPGTVFWLDGVEHSWELLAGEANVVGVEVKAAKAAKAAKAR